MRNNDKGEFIIVNVINKYYKYYAGYGRFTTLIRLAQINTDYKECKYICSALNEPGLFELVIKDANIVFRKEKLKKNK